MFRNSSGVASEDFDPFFHWLYNAHYADQDSPVIVQVTPDTISEHNATIVPPGPTPAVGFYLLRFEAWEVYAEVYGDDRAGAEADYHAARGETVNTLTVLDKHGSEVRIQVTGIASYDVVVNTGLRAMGETRDTLFGCGVRHHRRGDLLLSGTYTVYGDRT